MPWMANQPEGASTASRKPCTCSRLAHESGLSLAQAAVPNGVEEKTNEHKPALRWLEGLALEGRLVTGDAMFCQRDFCPQVIDARGDYLVFVKGSSCVSGGWRD